MVTGQRPDVIVKRKLESMSVDFVGTIVLDDQPTTFHTYLLNTGCCTSVLNPPNFLLRERIAIYPRPVLLGGKRAANTP
jgi:hypothetical protein